MNYFQNINEILKDNDFYPTPKELVIEMMGMLKKKELDEIKCILEPSAGAGDILDVINDEYGYNYTWMNSRDFEYDCCEIDSTKRSILKGKDYHIIGSDFLNFYTKKHYDLIIMNPPFSNGSEHLVKAISLAEENGGGTHIICLLNEETIKNPYSNNRKLLANKLKQYDAKIEFKEGAFSNAERKTDVSIAMIHIYIPCEKFTSFIYDELEKAEEIANDSLDYTEIVTDDYIHQAVAFYNKEVKLVSKLIKEYLAIIPYLSRGFSNSDSTEFENDWAKKPIVKLVLDTNSYSNDISEYRDINKVLEKIRYKYWQQLFHNEQFTAMLTSDMRQSLDSQLSEMKAYDFNLHNIEIVKKQFIGELLDGIENSIFKLFTKLSAEHTWYVDGQNIHYYNGWKSNKAHKVNKKVIIPIHGAFAESWHHKLLDEYTICSVLDDLEKTFNYLNTDNTPYYINSYDVIAAANRHNVSKNIEFRYFKINLYKKGTCHITFTNTNVLDALNIYVGRKRGWLPPSYGKVSYNDMSDEEKNVIDEFQGKDEYEKVFANPQKYIIETKDILALPENLEAE